MPWFVYVLRSIGYGRYYVGSSERPASRLEEHNRGKVNSTKAYLPWEICYLEEHPSRVEACRRERYIKGRKSRAWIESQLLGKDTGS